jgi:amino acid adenylation domain-containing protein
MSDNIEDLYPLSPLQGGMLFHALAEPGQGLYFNQLVCELRGRLEVEAFIAAWRGAVETHPVLRTALVWDDVDEPMQVVLREVDLPVRMEDWRGLTPEAREARLSGFLKDDQREGFDLSSAPLVRLALLRTEDAAWRFVFSHSHLMLDGWSLPRVLRDVFALYASGRGGQPRGLAAPRPYRDFIAWLAEREAGQARDFWRRSLAGFSEPTPLDMGGAPGGSTGRGERTLRLRAEETAALEAFARRRGLTPGTLVQAAWALLLGRYSGTDDVLFGVTVAGRPEDLRGVEDMVGLFINTLPARVRLPPSATVEAWLGALQDWLLEAQRHEHTPLVEVRRWSDVPAGTPLFESLVVVENYPLDAALANAVPGLEVRDIRSVEVDNHPLSLAAVPGRELTLRISYSAERLTAAAVERMSGHLRHLLLVLAGGEGRPLWTLSLLNGEERRRVLVEWNATAREYPRESTLPEVFARVVARSPDKVAVEFGETKLTYAQLDARANQLAWHLRGLGVSTDSRVAVALERSLELVVALVGILKAGGAYVPLDTAYPRERLAAMAEDARPQALVTVRALLPKLPAGMPATVLLDEAPLSRRPTRAPPAAALPESLAYIDFTSGSTGRPKGVGTPHAAVLRTLFGVDYAHLGPDETFLLIAPVSFDASTLELWGPLLHGGRLVVFPPHAPSDAHELEAVLVKHGVTTLHLTSGLFTQVVDSHLAGLRTVRQLLTGGDVVSARHVWRVLEELRAPVTACYGPTEATLFATCHRMTEAGQVGQVMPIGRPIGNTRVYVLDAAGQPVPVGVRGELYVGGDGVARGYVEQPALTAERFVPDAFSGVPGARLYRTGDLARWLPEGVLEFLGRADAQVKVRGYRIELAEVESALQEHPEVREAVVVARDAGAGDKRLVAYVTAREGDGLEAQALRAALKERLPEYMVPSAVVVLDSLPLTPSGKVNRKALPAPDLAAGGREDFVAPRTATEQGVASLFAEVLGLERVGLHDHFFELGGHSLLATRVMSRLRGAFGVDVPMRALFEAPTVVALARRIELLTRAGGASVAPPLGPRAERSVAPPLSFAQQRLWFLDQLEPGSASYNMPAVVRLTGPLESRALERSFRELVRRHESLRTTFRVEGNEPVQVISPEPVLAFSRVDLGSLPESRREAEARSHVEREVLSPFDLARGPLLRATLLRLGEQQHVLVLNTHHIVSDGWSTGVLVREVAALYDAFSQGLPSPLPEPPVQYADFAVWQRGWLRGEVLEGQLAYWREQLEGAPRALELPTDGPRPAAQTFRGGFRQQVWPGALWRQVEELSRSEGATPFMVLLAAYLVVLARYSGQEDISVGSPIAGRTHAETEGLIGYFANTLVLRARVRAEETFRELLAQVKEVTLGAYAHQDVPFEKLVEVLLPERDLSRGPLFQVSLTLQNMPPLELRLRQGLTLTGMEADTRTSKFDFSLMVEEVPEGVSAVLNYNSDLFEAETAERLLGHVRVLLESAVADPKRRVWGLPLMTAREQRRLVEEWSGRRGEYPREQSLAALFEAQVERTPEAVAVEYEGQRLTYAQLNSRANQLAHHLRGMGVGPEARVGLCVERSLELVVSVLGILKAGAAYVPLDASYPLERLGWMKREAGVALLVAQERLAEEVAEGGELVVCVDTEWDVIARQPVSNPASRVGGAHLAYVMFTSGSTGRPKGVGVPQRAVARLVLGTDYARFGPEEVWLQLAPISFDASTLELWGALLHGAKLVVYRAGTPSLEELGRTLEEAGVTSLWLTAALFEQMQAHQPRALGRVRQVLAGGDVLSPARARERLAGGGVLVNGYGPTENTTFSACHRMESPEDAGSGTVPIGRPIAGTVAYVLDGHLQPVPVGVPGELYVGGDGLAVGYVGRPEWTAERFVPDPFGKGARLYRTGDRVRWLKDGTLEFLGRGDTQVKVRGYRIELGEVEEALRQQPRVREAVAVVREDTPGDKRLVAYVVAPEADATALREALRQKLPEYMVPSAVVALDALPLSPNGKVDRRALPVPDSRGSARPEHLAPNTETEHRLAALWAEVLGGGVRVGRDDDFFELGGHSLLATQLVSRIRATLGVELPLRALFEAPTLEALARRIDSARQGGFAPGVPPLAPVPRTGAPLLSFAQQRLWFLDQLSPGGTAYNIPVSLLVEGAPRLDALRRAFSALVARHESLRTTFAMHEGQPIQVIHAPVDFPLAVEDLSTLPEAERREAARRRAVREALRPFDLGSGPLLRACLLRLAPEEHVLVLVMHHIVSDGWSMGVMVRELGALYAAFSEGRPSPLPELTVQYADYAVWQRGWLSAGALEAQLAWWKQALAGAPPHLELPTDQPRPAVLSHRGATVPVRLSRALSDALSALAQREGATPFMVLLAGFQVLLARYSGQEDLSVGSPIAGRRYAETEGLIGFFVNTLVLRSRVRRQATFRELLAQVRETTLGAYEHQDLPFEKLVEALQPVRDLGRSALFQVLFVLQNTPMDALALPSLSLKPMEVEGTEAARFELTLNLTGTPEGFAGILLFNTDLFTEATAARMVAHLQSLLESITRDPDQRVSELPLMTPSERQQVLSAWNDAAADFPRDTSLHHLIERQAARTPDAPAVRCEDTVLSYRRLDARANQLAHHLRSLGVGPEVPVALCLERGVDLVVALLGVLKAGGAYVPLEPSQPASRLRTLVDEVAAPVVVTESRHAASFESSRARRVLMDAEAERLAHHRTEAPGCGVLPEHLAYVLFTSGSTGRPKGVAVSHGQLVNYVHAATERLRLTECTHFALVSTFSADLGNTVLFPALCTGGVLHVLTQERAGSPADVAAYFQRHAVDCVKIVPSHLAALLTAAEPRHVLPRKRLVLGGESSTWALLEQVRALAPECEVFNHYGPTETTVGVLAGRVEPSSPHTLSPVPLGRALANTRLYVLDEDLHPMPPGVPGELYIGGAQVTRGYLGRPELTAERYIPDPYNPVPGARMYRTGDRVRWLADGRVEFLGRADFQVKVRGFRVEPGEIAAVLREHASVREAVVVARDAEAGDTRLVAYVTASEGPSPDGASLRAFVQERLPAHMVPAAFVVLDALPLTPNGKLDREALPGPEASSSAASRAYEAPATPTEQTLAAVWAEVLRIERVGRDDDFFALGGHSLLATQVVARLRALLGVEVPLRGLFEAPTPRSFAQRVDTAARGLSVPAPRPVPRSGPPPLSFAQQRLWFLDRLQPGSTTYNVPIVLSLEGPLDVGALEAAFTELVRRHESLRTRFPDEGGVPVQLIEPPGPLPLAVTDLHMREDRESEALRLAREEAARPFDLARGPLLRVSLLRLSGERHLLLLTLHHIISDGWSSGVLVRELEALYEGFVAGRSPTLPELPLQYADYCVWQREWLRGDVLESQLTYWKRHLAGAPHALELPTDFPRPPVPSSRGASFEFQLSPRLSRELQTLCRAEGVTLFMALLGAFQVVLARHSGQDDVVVGTPVAGRRFAELEGLIGFFVNTLALRTRLEGDPSFRELLGRVRETTLDAQAHQDIPFEKLVEELRPQRDLGRSPLFQVMFILQNTPDAGGHRARGAGALSLRPVSVEQETTRFDLTVSLGEGPEGVQGQVGYRTDLFREETVRRWMAHLRALLEAVTARPELRLSEPRLLTPEEQRQLLVDFQGRPEAYPRDVCLHALIEAQVERTPDAEAVRFEDSALTYARLDARANQLAHHLRSLGVGPETPVGVCLERSLELVVALLGVLKAGGAYVPLDPAYPQERLAGMLEDVDAPVLLTQRHLLDVLPPHAARVLCLDSGWDTVARESTSRPSRLAGPESLAYVIFTSGSTGRPKGAMNAHAGIVNRLLWMQGEYGLTAADTVLQKTPFSFDVSVWELFWPLMTGARLVLARPGGHQDPAYLAWLMERERVTTAHFVPSMLRAFVKEPGLERLAHLRTVVCSGEALPAPVVRRAQARLPAARVHNLYGPTEAAVDVTSWECPRDDARPTVPIGRPVANTRIYIVDRHGQLAPVGVPGELLIGGIQVGRGYWRRPELTAERFVPDSFSGTPGARLYRTGDLARWRPDGTVEYLGRFDFQVKLRGFRIELGEVEVALREHPGVGEAVVVAREDGPGGTRLVAYVVPVSSAAPDGARSPEGSALEVAELRAALSRRLPAYMVPSAFVVLEALPLTPSGKVDRKALPAPEDGAAPTGPAHEPPRTPLEQALAAVWARVLRLEEGRVGRRDDFFALGGHSLLAAQVVARAREALGMEVPLRALFEAPTVERLAAWLEGERREGPERHCVTLQPEGTGTPVFFVHAVGGAVGPYRELARVLGPGRPFHALRASGLGGSEPPLEEVEALARRYVAAVRAVRPEGPYVLGGWSMGGVVAFEMARELERQGQRVELLVLLDSFAPVEGAPRPEPEGALLLAGLAMDLARTAGAEPTLRPERLMGLSEAEQLAHVTRHAREAGWLPPEVRDSDLRAWRDVMRANLRAQSTYRPGPYGGPVLLLRARDAKREHAVDPTHGWSRWVEHGLTVEDVPGDHYGVLRAPHVAALAARILAHLDEVAEDG